MVTRTLVRLAAPRWLCVAIVVWSACSSPLPPPAEQTDEIDFYQASGITQPELAGFLEGLEERENLRDYPLHILLQDKEGDYLADSRVIVRWDTGENRLLVGRSGVIQVLLEKQKLPAAR